MPSFPIQAFNNNNDFYDEQLLSGLDSAAAGLDVMELSQEQLKAVNHSGSPALVVAGAGSGKTRTLTAKIHHLIQEGHDPERMLAITFTNKAADEMKKRLYQLTGLGYNKFPWVRTYHSACLKIFKAHCHLLGYRMPIQVCSVYQQKKLMTEVLVERNVDKKNADRFISTISRAKNSGNPGAYFDFKPVVAGIRIKDIFDAYEKKLFQANSVDFDNIFL